METLNSKLETLNKFKIKNLRLFGFWSFEFVSGLGFRVLNLSYLHRLQRTQRGSVLLLTLLLLSLFLFIGLSWSVIVLRGLKIVEKADEAVVAFAAAESGIEDGLYRLKAKNRTGNKDILINGASWDENSYNQVKEKVFDTLGITSAPAIVDLYNPDVVDPLTATPAALKFGATSLQISWEGLPLAILTMSLAQWDGKIFTAPSVVTLNNGNIMDVLKPENMYRLSLTASAPVKNIRITAREKSGGAGAEIPIPESLSIESNGFYRSATQAIRMRFPLESPIP